MPELTVITNTGDRPEVFALCERWMARQDYPGDWQWIVTDDGGMPTACTMGQDYLRRDPRPDDPPHTQTLNIELALQHVRGDSILFVEDDDWYAPGYLSSMVRWLASADLVGDVEARYYSLRYRGWKVFDNHWHASLCRTGIGPDAMETFRLALHAEPGEGSDFRHRDESHDMRLWSMWQGKSYAPCGTGLSVSFKDVPGRRGSTWIDWGYRPDPNHDQLRAWVGDDWPIYAEMMDRVPCSTI